MITPIGMPKQARTALREFKQMGFVVQPLEKRKHTKFVTLATESGMHPIDVNSNDMERAWGRGKTFKDAFLDLLTSISGKKFVTDINTASRKEYTAPVCEILPKGFETYGGYIKHGEEMDDICYVKTLSDGKKIQINPSGSWWGDAPSKMITSEESSKSQDYYRVYQKGNFMHFWNGEGGKEHHEDFKPTKLGHNLSKAIRGIASIFVSNDKKELLDVKLNLQGKPFGKWIKYN